MPQYQSMKRKITILTFLFLTNFAFSQEKEVVDVYIPLTGDTDSYYELCKQLKINQLINCKDTFYFRFWQDGQALDIWTLDYQSFQGQVTNFITKCYPKSSKPTKQFSNQIQLDTQQARLAYNLIIEQDILTIPMYETVGRDGEIYRFEIYTSNNYATKSYWSPSHFPNLLEARKVQGFVEKINSQLNLGELYRKLTRTLPRGAYSNGGFGTIHITKRIRNKAK